MTPMISLSVQLVVSETVSVLILGSVGASKVHRQENDKTLFQSQPARARIR